MARDDMVWLLSWSLPSPSLIDHVPRPVLISNYPAYRFSSLVSSPLVCSFRHRLPSSFVPLASSSNLLTCRPCDPPGSLAPCPLPKVGAYCIPRA